MINHREYCLCTPNVKDENLSVIVKGFLVASMKIDILSLCSPNVKVENLSIIVKRFVVVSMKLHIMYMYTKCKS